jgi:hypothetical protein
LVKNGLGHRFPRWPLGTSNAEAPAAAMKKFVHIIIAP